MCWKTYSWGCILICMIFHRSKCIYHIIDIFHDNWTFNCICSWVRIEYVNWLHLSPAYQHILLTNIHLRISSNQANKFNWLFNVWNEDSLYEAKEKLNLYFDIDKKERNLCVEFFDIFLSFWNFNILKVAWQKKKKSIKEYFKQCCRILTCGALINLNCGWQKSQK